jgi:hypothetical protein
MADFTPVASQSKPPTPMSLAEMVNLAGGIQSYQQAQQLNPLAVQRSAAELSRLQQLTPEELRRAQAEAGRAETEATVSEKTSRPRITISEATASSAESTAEKDRINLLNQKLKNIASSQIAMINNPLILEAEKNPNAVNTQQLVDLVMQNGMTIARDLNIKPDEAKALLQPYVDIATNNPGQLRQYFKERHLAGLDEASRTSALSPSGIAVDFGTGGQVTSTNEFSGVPVGQPIVGTAYKRYLMPGETIFTDQQGNNFIASKDSQGRLSIRPATDGGSSVGTPATGITNMPSQTKVQNAPPQVRELPAPLPASPQVQNALPQQNNVTSADIVAPGVRLPFPVRRSDQPYTAMPTEQKDATAGFDYRNNLVNAQVNLAQGRRNVDEVIQQAKKIGDQLFFEKGGLAGKAEQKIRMAIGSEQYDMLAKELANMAITNSKAMGAVGGTVAGLDMAAVANGTIKVPPDVLVKIASRVQADQRNIDMQASGAQQFGQKYGDNNMKAYQQAWNANARDTRIFEAMNILETETDPKKMESKFKELFPSEKKRKTILKQYKNLKSMAATGLPVEPLTAEDF